MNADRDSFDLLVIGGGINGAGIARDAAGRGLKVMLVEQGDLGGATSSASSKLAHGGLRYLETFEFRLVREALAERETLLAIAPHICRPLSFVLPHDPLLRPRWMIRLGLLLYDHLAARSRLPASRSIMLDRDMPGHPLKPSWGNAFTYPDCWIDDSRLVVLNAVDAAERGAQVCTRVRFAGARAVAGMWQARLQPAGRPPRSIAARMIVNVAGPWAGHVHASIEGVAGVRPIRLVKGSHVVVPRIVSGPEAYLLQGPDGRVVFLLPFEQCFTLIGTTDVAFTGEPSTVAIAQDETDYLLAAANRFLAVPVRSSDVVWSFSGVRALVDDRAAQPSKVTRDYRLELAHDPAHPPVLTVYGGKLTTYRRLAEQVLDRTAPVLPGFGPAWTSRIPLPGGDIEDADLGAFTANFKSRHPWLPHRLADRLTAAYGTRAERIVGNATAFADLGRVLGADLTERELGYLRMVEFAQTADDVLWRRSKIGLVTDDTTRARIDEAMADSSS